MTEYEKMLAGQLYRWENDEELLARSARAQAVLFRFNHDPRGDVTELKELFASAGEHFTVKPEFHCDYGCHISVGDHFFANYGCTILDVCRVTIGSHCLMGPNVALYTACHPLDAALRSAGPEYGKPITVGDNVWFGGNAVVCPGVTIGDNAVVAAGAVVTRDVPPNVVVAGNPARVIRNLNNQKPYRAVLFDFDYTLGDATDAIVAGFQYAMKTMGHPAPDRETVRRTVGYRLQDAYSLLTGDRDPERGDRFRDLFREVALPMELEDTPLFPGAKELLQALSRSGVRTGIVSTKRTDVLNKVFADHGVDGLLELVVGGDRVTLPKPDPQGINDALNALGLKKEEVLYCGDTVLDAGAAQRAGVDFAAVLNGTTTADAFAPFPFVHIAPDLCELRTWLSLEGE